MHDKQRKKLSQDAVLIVSPVSLLLRRHRQHNAIHSTSISSAHLCNVLVTHPGRTSYSKHGGRIRFIFLHFSGLLQETPEFPRYLEKGVNYSSLQIWQCNKITSNHSEISKYRCKKLPMYANKTVKTSTIMESHCSSEAGCVDKMKYLSSKLSITFGNHIEFKGRTTRSTSSNDVSDICRRSQNRSRSIEIAYNENISLIKLII